LSQPRSDDPGACTPSCSSSNAILPRAPALRQGDRLDFSIGLSFRPPRSGRGSLGRPGPGRVEAVWHDTPARKWASSGAKGRGLILRFAREDVGSGGKWSGYEFVSREGQVGRRPVLLVVEPAR